MSAAPSRNSGPIPELRAVAIIPARLASQRLPRKMLLDRTGRPLFVHTAQNVAASGAFARVVVATDSPEILAAAAAHGVEARLTRADHPSGTDRVNECYAALCSEGERAAIIVNVQGDEPDLSPLDLAQLVAAFDDRTVELATLAAPLATSTASEAALFAAPSVVKVVCDARGDALYFSRAPIPALGHAAAAGEAEIARRHVGVYAFTPTALARFCALPRGILEQRESLEQLRWLEHGGKLRVIAASRAPQGIDTLRDYEEFVTRTLAGSQREQGNPLREQGDPPREQGDPPREQAHSRRENKRTSGGDRNDFERGSLERAGTG
jgi:3-deoxy-manno-octulosonate cytidylyltransferase (CMP-KDO synthetase)